MTYEDVLNFCEEQDVRFIRLSYFDMYGTQKNVSVLPTELKRAFVEGISFDASAIDGFLDEVHSDLFLYPDPNTMSILPWLYLLFWKLTQRRELFMPVPGSQCWENRHIKLRWKAISSRLVKNGLLLQVFR